MMDLRVVGNGDKGIACAIRIRWCGRNLVVEFEREESTTQCRAFLSAVMSRKMKYFAPGTHPGHRSSASTSIVLRPEETRFTPSALHAQTNYHIHSRRGTTPPSRMKISHVEYRSSVMSLAVARLIGLC